MWLRGFVYARWLHISVAQYLSAMQAALNLNWLRLHLRCIDTSLLSHFLDPSETRDVSVEWKMPAGFCEDRLYLRVSELSRPKLQDKVHNDG